MNLLIVNDEPITTKMIREKVDWTALGISQVLCAYSAAQAQEIFENEDVDILLCDIEMPGEDGIELIRWIKGRTLDCDCIFLTCHADFKYAQEAIKLGVMDYLLLPARYEEIAKSVSKAIQRRQERHSHEEIYKYGQKWLNTQTEELNKKNGYRCTGDELVAACVAYIQNNLSSMELSVNSLAAQFYMNRVYLNRIFKKTQHVSISQYIINERMKLASQLLKKPSLTLNAVSEGVGYNSYSYFVSAFKKFYGCTPSQYRKDHQSS